LPPQRKEGRVTLVQKGTYGALGSCKQSLGDATNSPDVKRGESNALRLTQREPRKPKKLGSQPVQERKERCKSKEGFDFL